jgi:hypothetical protein
MGPRPWNPRSELDAALERGDLDFAITLADELRIERGRPVDLRTALRFLPLIAAERPDDYDTWSLRWLGRWIVETPETTIDHAADVTTALAAVPVDPDALIAIQRVVAH